MTKRRFQNRFIAFVDILGFRGIVERMSGDEKLFETIRDALQGLDRQSRDFRKYRHKERDKVRAILESGSVPLIANSDLQMTAFSDCYVISEVSPAWHVLAAVHALGARLLEKGILTRGAVVQGGAYHNGRVLFGRGIIEAYELESEVAKYPRIIVTEAVRQAVWGYHEGRWSGRLLKRDVDGCWFVNLLVPSLSSWAPLSDAASGVNVEAYLRRVRRSLQTRWRQAQGNASHMSKVWWLIHRYNKAVETIEGLEPIRDPHRT
jgi:hypothetical protein